MMVLLAPCVCKALKHKALETTEQRQKAGHAPSCEEALALCASAVSVRLSPGSCMCYLIISLHKYIYTLCITSKKSPLYEA